MDTVRIPTRREILHGGIVAALVTPRALAADAATMRAVVKMDGKTFEYAAKSGVNLGTFKSEIGGFSQDCFRVEHPACPLVVYFRPDVGSVRREVVFELGRIWNSQPAHLGAYAVTLWEGTDEIATIEVPKHFWFARWRWQSEPRPIVGKITELIEKHLLPPYAIPALAQEPGAVRPADDAEQAHKSLPTGGGKGLPGTPALTSRGMALGLGQKPVTGKGAPPPTSIEYTIMGLAGVTPQMGMTGERPDIGLITEFQAQYVFDPREAALKVVHAQAEAAGTVPWHLRDEKTGAPVDLNAYPRMSWYGTPKADPSVRLLNSDVSIDAAHQPALSYLPYMLTGDPYHLESMQFAANWNRGCLPPEYRLSIPQTRAFAWSLRTLFQCAKVTPVATPKWLLPRSYWEAELDEKLKWVTSAFVENPSPVQSVFRVVDDVASRREEGPEAPQGSYFAPWEDEFVANVLGWGVWMGFGAWRKVYEWKIASTIARTDGQSGWGRSWPVPYRLALRTAADKPFVRTWAEAWQLFKKNNPNPPPTDDDKQAHGDIAYLSYANGSLIFAVRNGISGAQEPQKWLAAQIAQQKGAVAFKWKLA